MPTRRRVLATGGALVPFGLAGCSAITSVVDSPPELTHVLVGNGDTVEHTVHLVVTQGESVVHWAEYSLDPVDDSGQYPELDTVSIPGSELGLDDDRPFTVRARLDGRSQHRSLTVTDEASHPCGNVDVRVEPDDQGEPASLVVRFLGTAESGCTGSTPSPAE